MRCNYFWARRQIDLLLKLSTFEFRLEFSKENKWTCPRLWNYRRNLSVWIIMFKVETKIAAQVHQHWHFGFFLSKVSIIMHTIVVRGNVQNRSVADYRSRSNVSFPLFCIPVLASGSDRSLCLLSIHHLYSSKDKTMAIFFLFISEQSTYR